MIWFKVLLKVLLKIIRVLLHMDKLDKELEDYKELERKKTGIKGSIAQEMLYADISALNNAYEVLVLPSTYKVYNNEKEVVISKKMYDVLIREHPEYLV